MDFLDEIGAAVPALRRYARALTRSADRADDLVQDCIERAIRKRGLFRPAGPLRPWLFKVLLNIHRNRLRDGRRKSSDQPMDTTAAELSTPAPQHGRLALAEVARALDTLPDEQREAILLIALEGLAYSEAAHVLSIPVGTLMSRLSRGRAALRARTGTGEEPRLRAVK